MKITITIGEFLYAFSEALDKICPQVVDHHKDVAYWAGILGEKLQLTPRNISLIVESSLLHDIGIFSIKSRLESLSFEFEMEKKHAFAGAKLLSYAPYFYNHSHIILHHHDPYDENPNAPIESQIIYLADRIAVSLQKDRHILIQRDGIKKLLELGKGKKFNPKLVEVFFTVLPQDALWLDFQRHRYDRISKYMGENQLHLNYDTFMDFGKLFIRAVDFRSRYTAAHSMAVGYIVQALAKFAGYSEDSVEMLTIAGYFHDIGKVVVPCEILDKPSIITRDEMEIIKEHPYYTRHILSNISGLKRYIDIAAQHHERYDGSGYPYHLQRCQISPETNLLALADIFSAITENRSYRPGMTQNEVFKALDYYENTRAFDGKIISYIKENFIPLQQGILDIHTDIFKEYNAFEKELQNV